ncbi:MAG: alpha-galactosidase [Clostridia bacterium]|nr:alpha-galactosidase [Clostridia bacterium]
MNENKLYIKYKFNGKIYEDDLYQTQHYFIEDNTNENELKITIIPREKMEIMAFELRYQRKYANEERIFCNGYQSWTTSREYRKGDKYRGITGLTKLLPMLKHLPAASSDQIFYEYPKTASVFHSYTYTYFRKESELELWGSLSERQGFTVFKADLNKNTFIVAKEVEGLVIDKPYELFNLVRIKGAYDTVFDAYFGAMNLPKPRTDFLSGYTSWYNYFTHITEEIIMRDLNSLDRVKDSVNIFQIDDGYEPTVGDWLIPNPDFPNGMKYLADKIHEKGYKAGLWLAPFNATKKSKIVEEHPDWLLRKPNGKPVLGCIAWGGAYTLDLYHPEARAYIKDVLGVVVNEWGYDMVKLDFLYSQCMIPRGGKTRGTIMTEAMEFLRECVGDKLILGCGVPLGPSFGYVDACRIGCDVDLKYKPKYYNKLLISREIPSAQNSINNAIQRRHLNKRAFCSDPDVFFLRDYNLKFTKEQKLLLAKVNNLFGGVLFVSDDVGTYGEEEIELLKKFFEQSKAIVISAEYVDDDNITIFYLEDGARKKLSFRLSTGEGNIQENI